MKVPDKQTADEMREATIGDDKRERERKKQGQNATITNHPTNHLIPVDEKMNDDKDDM